MRRGTDMEPLLFDKRHLSVAGPVARALVILVI